MTTFDDREKAFETKYKADLELQFRVTARRNKLLGLWVAEQIGKSGADAEAYAKEVVVADMEKRGDDDVIEKVTRDLAAAGAPASEVAIRRKLEQYFTVAREQVMAETKL